MNAQSVNLLCQTDNAQDVPRSVLTVRVLLLTAPIALSIILSMSILVWRYVPLLTTQML